MLLDLNTDFSGDRSGIPTSFPQFVVIHTVKSFSVANEAEIDFFFNSFFFFFFYHPTDVGNLISGSSAFSKSSLYIWNFSVHVLLKPILKDFEHSQGSMWKKHNYIVVWTFFDIVLLWDWNENRPFPVLWPLLSFPNTEWSTLIASSFRIWNSSAGIPSPPLA